MISFRQIKVLSKWFTQLKNLKWLKTNIFNVTNYRAFAIRSDISLFIVLVAHFLDQLWSANQNKEATEAANEQQWGRGLL